MTRARVPWSPPCPPAVHDAGGIEARLGQRAKGAYKAVGGPGAGLLVQILKRVGGFKSGAVDDHAVRGHAQRVLVVLAVHALACGHDGLAGGADVGQGLLGPQVAQVQHLAGSAPVGHQTLRAFHDDVRGGAGLNGAGHLIVAGLIVKVLNRHADVGIYGVEIGDDGIHRFGVGPVADGIGPQGDVHLFLSEGRHGQHHHEAQKQREQLFHGWVPPCDVFLENGLIFFLGEIPHLEG